LAKFSFFVTSLGAMRDLAKEFGAGDQGFGGDLRYGEATGLAGADKICRTIAERAMPGAGKKTWRAFLSATKGGENDGPIHAKDRVGKGPWYDAVGRLVATNLEDLLQDRPRGADPAIINDLPNEFGIPNHKDGAPGCTGMACPDNHQVLTGTNEKGMLYSFSTSGQMGGTQYTSWDATCHDWTTREQVGRPWCGHSWPRQGSGTNWMSSYYDAGCAPCIAITERGGVLTSEACVGSAGGYGGFYCLAINSP
ncbi:MAG TPA: hypothetical protein VFQ61_20120, partial [Polyangiaceae bacterium]|nr:hypothetical protein [Polyangiaceae bacterium]